MINQIFNDYSQCFFSCFIVLICTIKNVYKFPSHPYTEVLLGAVLEPDPDIKPKLVAEDIVEDKPPEKGCCFQGRCPRLLGDKCKNENPPWQIGDNGNAIRCHINIKDLEKKQNGN